MHQYRVDEWVMYHQFPGADTEWLRRGKRAAILECLENKRYKIFIDDPDLDEKWRRKEVNEEDLKPIY